VLLVLSGFGSVDDAVAAVRAGAADFLAKPLSGDRLRVALDRALERRDLTAENRRLREDLGQRYELGKLTSTSPLMQQVFERVRAVASTTATLLVEGESGTGKTLLARSAHAASGRASGPFVEVNCGALPEALLESELFGHVRGAFTGADRDRPGKFEAAHGGTIFLDEIATASLDLQVKLLRVLQDRVFEPVGSTETRRVDVRVIAATNENLREAVAEGRFREDLYYRLHVVPLELPPLRERRGDVAYLAERFATEIAATHGRPFEGFEPRALAALAAHDWPGNVRELQNCIERAVLLSPTPRLGLEALPEELQVEAPAGAPRAAGALLDLLEGRDLRAALELAERELVLAVLRENAGSRKESARRLGINRTTLFNKMTRFGLMDEDFSAVTVSNPTPPAR
jgi:DNA-binding NtrC family response regulator